MDQHAPTTDQSPPIGLIVLPALIGGLVWVAMLMGSFTP